MTGRHSTIDFKRLRQRLEGEVLLSDFDRGRYATDASIYQIMPRAVAVPKSWEDVEAALDFAKSEGVPILARGGGTSQSGQTVNDALVLDFSKHLNGIVSYDAAAGTAEVQPGLVLDDLNRHLKRDGWWFPVDVSTASRATLGGMAANNSCGSRSIRYGKMRDNVDAITAMTPNGALRRFERADASMEPDRNLLALARREASEIDARFPKVQRRVGGYNIDALVGDDPNMAHLLVGSEGTLGLTQSVSLRLSPVLQSKTLGVCHFPDFRSAMDAAQHIVKLGPVAVELVDHNMIRLGREIPQFRPVVDSFVKGSPGAILLVEFAEDAAENRRRLTALDGLMAELGFRWGDPAKKEGGVVEAEDPEFQARIWNVRSQGLNIMMSMRSAARPVSFVEDCAVPLEHLAEFTDRLTEIFRKHGTDGTWYAHASVGLLHVRPVLNLRQDLGVRQLRAIAEESFECVRAFKGSHSGEHGDGIVRSEFHERMFGKRMVDTFETIKDTFDPEGLFNPGKIVRAPKMDDRSLMRWPPGYEQSEPETAFDWSDWPAGLSGAAEMCNNNGACRKSQGGVMCPSFRVTGNERDSTRGRANTLRLATTGNLGPDAFASDEMAQTMSLCVGCKACKSECPMSVDMAKMKLEVTAARAAKHGMSLRERMIASLPKFANLCNKNIILRSCLQFVQDRFATFLGFSTDRKLPRFRVPFTQSGDGEVLLFADTFNTHFNPENLNAARVVLERSGKTVGVLRIEGPPLCCGRTYLSAGMVGRAQAEMERTTKAFREAIENGKMIVGLEPSCTLLFRDEAVNLVEGWTADLGAQVLTFAEYIAAHPGHLKASQNAKILIHGHCHQKSSGVASHSIDALNALDGVEAAMIDSSCCGMAGAFGYQKETAQISRDMAELALAPAVRAASQDTLIVADGFSCRCQISDTTQRQAESLAITLEKITAQ